MHCVDLDESFPMSIYFQNLASIQPRTSPLKFVGSRAAAGAAAAAASAGDLRLALTARLQRVSINGVRLPDRLQ